MISFFCRLKNLLVKIKKEKSKLNNFKQTPDKQVFMLKMFDHLSHKNHKTFTHIIKVFQKLKSNFKSKSLFIFNSFIISQKIGNIVRKIPGKWEYLKHVAFSLFFVLYFNCEVEYKKLLKFLTYFNNIKC